MEIFKNFQNDELKGQHIRATTEVPRRISVFDAIKVITGNENPWETWSYTYKKYPEVLDFAEDFKFPGRGQKVTPVVGARGLVTIMNLLPGENAARFRAAEAEVLVRYLGGDLSLIQEIQGIRKAQEQLPADHPARIFGEQVEAVQKLGDLSEKSASLTAMLNTSQQLVAIQPYLEQTSGLLKGFPFQDFEALLNLRIKEVELDERQLGVKQKQFTLTQQEDEHGMKMAKAKADISEAPQKRQRAAGGEQGITISEILGAMSKTMPRPSVFLKQAEDAGVRLKAFNEFGDKLVPGFRDPRRYQKDAASDIAQAISRWVTAACPTAASGIRKYFAPSREHETSEHWTSCLAVAT